MPRPEFRPTVPPAELLCPSDRMARAAHLSTLLADRAEASSPLERRDVERRIADLDPRELAVA